MKWFFLLMGCLVLFGTILATPAVSEISRVTFEVT